MVEAKLETPPLLSATPTSMGRERTGYFEPSSGGRTEGACHVICWCCTWGRNENVDSRPCSACFFLRLLALSNCFCYADRLLYYLDSSPYSTDPGRNSSRKFPFSLALSSKIF